MSAAEFPCSWAPLHDPLYRGYHDEEWGVPERRPEALYEKLMLDGLQAGLSWITILRKRAALREAFDGFDPERVARFDDAKVAALMADARIIRSERKIASIIKGAQVYLQMMERGEDFSDYLWAFVDGAPIQNAWTYYREAPTATPLSERIAKDLKRRGFGFCGPTITYAFMQAVGMINDHEVGCPRRAQCAALA